MSYIAVEGPIGAGKTTLAELLGERLRAKLVLEQFEENPFLGAFYADRRRYAFQTQIFFLLSRYRQQRELSQTDLFYENVVSDYIYARDRIFASVNLTEEELALYDEVEYALGKTVPDPDVVIYLQASVADLMESVHRRGREFEQPISEEYLTKVVEAYNDYFFHYRESRLIVVEAQNIDFLTQPQEVDRLLAAIYRNPHPPVEYLTAPRSVPFFSQD